MLNLPVDQGLRHHPGHRAAAKQRRIRQRAHHSGAAATIYQTDLQAGKGSAHLARGLNVDLVVPGVRTAEYTDAHVVSGV